MTGTIYVYEQWSTGEPVHMGTGHVLCEKSVN